jgi:hypothetical protein
MSLQFVERSVPALFVASARGLVAQTRMSEGQFGALGRRAQIDLDQRFAGILAALPSPAHCQAFGSYDLEIFAAALVLAAIERAEADSEAPADAHVGLGQQHGAGIRAPPAGNAVRRRERVEDDGWPRRDPAHEGEAGHRPLFFASASLRSA